MFPLILTFSRREKEQPVAVFGNANVLAPNPTAEEAGVEESGTKLCKLP